MHKSFFVVLFSFAATTALCEQPHPPRTFRNPFQPVIPPTATPDQRERQPLEHYALNVLKLTAIVTNAAGELFASVETPEGIGFKVVRGTVVGQEGARVIEISKSGIVVEEGENERRTMREILLRPRD
jgi:Tfp pilus assembly protein PilP